MELPEDISRKIEESASSVAGDQWLPSTRYPGMVATYSKIPAKSQYLKLAEQCDKQARTAKTEGERRDYQQRAALWRQLASARLDKNSPVGHFSGTKRRPNSR
jgi:hypothetical protein